SPLSLVKPPLRWAAAPARTPTSYNHCRRSIIFSPHFLATDTRVQMSRSVRRESSDDSVDHVVVKAEPGCKPFCMHRKTPVIVVQRHPPKPHFDRPTVRGRDIPLPHPPVLQRPAGVASPTITFHRPRRSGRLIINSQLSRQV